MAHTAHRRRAPGAPRVARELSAARALVTQKGARATLENDGECEVLRVHDNAGYLLFEHRPGEHTSVVFAPHGDLVFSAPHGNIAFDARDTVKIQGGRALELHAARSVQIGTPTAEGRAAATVTLQPRGIDVTARALDTRAARVALSATEVDMVAARVTSAVETAQHVVGELELRATRIVERARNVFRDATELSQTAAARVRLIAETALEALGREVVVEAERDIKLKGEKIHLG